MYLVERPKRGEESNVLGEIREQPEMMFGTGQHPHNAKHDEANERQAEDEHEKASRCDTQIVDTFAVIKRYAIFVSSST